MRRRRIEGAPEQVVGIRTPLFLERREHCLADHDAALDRDPDWSLTAKRAAARACVADPRHSAFRLPEPNAIARAGEYLALAAYRQAVGEIEVTSDVGTCHPILRIEGPHRAGP